MELSENDQSKIRQYLLGQLNDADEQKIEERLMVEDDLFQELEISKGELVEEYRAGELRETERREFEQRFLATPEGRDAHIFHAALGCLNPTLPAVRNPTLVERIRDFVGQRPWALATAAAVVLIAIVVVPPMLRDRPQSSISIALTSSAGTRSGGSGGYQKIAVTPDVGEVKASLKLPEPPVPQSNYRAVLDDQLNTKAVKVEGHAGDIVSVVIPADLLPPGLYALRLYSIAPDGSEQPVPGEYQFQVTR